MGRNPLTVNQALLCAWCYNNNSPACGDDCYTNNQTLPLIVSSCLTEI